MKVLLLIFSFFILGESFAKCPACPERHIEREKEVITHQPKKKEITKKKEIKKKIVRKKPPIAFAKNPFFN